MKFYVDIIESERGWGSKVDSTKEFDTLQEAQIYASNYNKEYNTEPEAPDWYMMAEVRMPSMQELLNEAEQTITAAKTIWDALDKLDIHYRSADTELNQRTSLVLLDVLTRYRNFAKRSWDHCNFCRTHTLTVAGDCVVCKLSKPGGRNGRS